MGEDPKTNSFIDITQDAKEASESILNLLMEHYVYKIPVEDAITLISRLDAIGFKIYGKDNESNSVTLMQFDGNALEIVMIQFGVESAILTVEIYSKNENVVPRSLNTIRGN